MVTPGDMSSADFDLQRNGAHSEFSGKVSPPPYMWLCLQSKHRSTAGKCTWKCATEMQLDSQFVGPLELRRVRHHNVHCFAGFPDLHTATGV